MKRFLFALMALAIFSTSAHAQAITFGEKVLPFRSTGLSSGSIMPISTGQTLYADTSYTSRGGAAWGVNVTSQTDTTVWFSTADLPDFALSMGTRGTSGAVTDSFFVFNAAFVPDPSNVAFGLTCSADSVYVTFQGTNDGGQNVSSASYNQLANPSSANGFTRTFNTQLFNTSNPSAIGLATFFTFRQWRFIISSDINGRYILSLKYPKWVR